MNVGGADAADTGAVGGASGQAGGGATGGDAGCDETDLACFCQSHACPSSIDADFCQSPPVCTAERFEYAACLRTEIVVNTSIGQFAWLFDSMTGQLVGAAYGTDVSHHGPAGETLSPACVSSSLCRSLHAQPLSVLRT